MQHASAHPLRHGVVLPLWCHCVTSTNACPEPPPSPCAAPHTRSSAKPFLSLRHWLSAPQLLPPSQTDSCQHALGHVMSVLPHHPRKPTYSTRPNPILDAASSSPQGYLASSPPVPARCRNISSDFQGYPGGYVSTLRDAHVSHNSIPGPQGVQSSGETAPVMGRSLITTRASPLIGPTVYLQPNKRDF